MREIKFRAWQDGKMRTLDQVQVGVGQIGFSDTHYTDLSMDDQEPIELMQFTGLKDKNGVEIYEGDICNVPDKQEVIEWDSHYACFNTPMLPNKYWEVIGNIYENPELVK